MSSAFYISPSHSSDSSISSNDSASLPFPKPLSRSAFLVPEFDATAFLSTLTSRFQTLEDLRSELASLSQQIQTELVDLVNDNYSEFLTLGSSLSGGEEKIEEVRVGLLGFERDVQGLREKVVKERECVAALLSAKKDVMREIAVGRSLLEIEERVGELEIGLGLKERETANTTVFEGAESDLEEPKEQWSEEWNDEAPIESDDEYDDDGKTAIPPRLRKRTEQFLMIVTLAGRFQAQHPFLVAEQARVRRIRETLLLDLDAAIRAETDVKGKQEIMRLRSSVEE